MYYFIVNPFSQSGNTVKLMSRISDHLKAKFVDYEILTTSHAHHATQITRELTSHGDHKNIVVVGGDGFLNEVVNGILDFDKVTLGYIPSGSGNDFARSMKIPTNPIKALNIVLSNKEYRKVNVGFSLYNNLKRRFIVSSGLGFDAGVCHGVATSKFKPFLNKIGLGKLVYMVVALQQIFFRPPTALEVVLDDGEPLKFSKCLFAAGMNMPYEGGGYKFCPDARPDDDILDLCVIDNVSPWQFLYMMPTAFSGKHVKFSAVNLYKCRKAVLRPFIEKPLHTDGEPLPCQSEVIMGLEKQKLEIITG